MRGKIRYPKPIKRGDRIGITAPSSGVPSELHPRLDLVLEHLRTMGFQLGEGKCLRSRHKHVSAPKEVRAQEFQEFWFDPEVRAIMPPWGGEVLVEILPLIDIERLSKHEPTWLSGFSDISTLLFALTVKTGTATLHTSNLMDLSPKQSDLLTQSLFRVMSLNTGESITQYSSEKFQKKWADFKTEIDAPYNLTETTEWKILNRPTSGSTSFSGRLIGGCLDTIARLAGTPYGNLPEFIHEHSRDGVIFYFENCEMPPCELVRTLWNLRLAAWFKNLKGMIIGRSSGPDASSEADLTYREALDSVLGGFDFPIIFDADLGHKPPNLNIVNGAMAEVQVESGRGIIKQTLI